MIPVADQRRGLLETEGVELAFQSHFGAAVTFPNKESGFPKLVKRIRLTVAGTKSG